jgi:hypothetical protein
LNADDYIFFKLENRGQDSVYVHIFGIDGAGNINCISAAKSEGILLRQGYSEEVSDDFDGIPMEWPDPVPREGIVLETFVFIITSESIDLRDLQNGDVEARLGRGTAQQASWKGQVRYHIEKIDYKLAPSPPIPASKLPLPEDKLKDIVLEGKSLFGGISRSLRGVKDEIRVVNQSDKAITVTVTHYNRQTRLKNLSINGGSTGGGFGFETEVLSPSKQFPPKNRTNAWDILDL